MRPFNDPDVAAAFEAYPVPIRKRLLALRDLIYRVAASLDDVGELEETLKWGEPAYLTTATKSGTTIRLGWKAPAPSHYALHVHCQTNLIEKFRVQFPVGLAFEGNRSIVFDEGDELPVDAVSTCIAAALQYHRKKKRGRQA